jgi:peroxiredoxin
LPLASLRTAVAALCLLALTACSGSGTSSSGLVSFSVDQRKAAPDLTGETILHKVPFSLAAERGHVVVVNYWASWCDPCREELPALHEVWDDFASKDVTFIGVDFRGDGAKPTAAKAFMEGHQVPYDSLFDPDSRTVLQFRDKKVTIASPPVTLVIDKQGRIAAVFNGVVVYSQLRDTIAAEQAAA